MEKLKKRQEELELEERVKSDGSRQAPVVIARCSKLLAPQPFVKLFLCLRMQKENKNK